MPNGRPGDHPFTDILHYGKSEFGDPVDGLVTLMSKHPGFEGVKKEVADLLWDLSPMGKSKEKKQKLVSEAFRKLQQIKTKLENPQ